MLILPSVSLYICRASSSMERMRSSTCTGAFPAFFVDGLNVHNAVVVIVDIVELVVDDQILMQRLHLGVELFLALAEAMTCVTVSNTS